MILALDAGNSNIVIGGILKGEIVFISRIATDHGKTEDQYAITLNDIFHLYGARPENFSGAIISSVVPPLTGILQNAVEKLIHKTPLVVGSGLRTGLNIRTNNPAQLGSDIVANNVAALEKYTRPVIVIDMGTATTISCSDEEGVFLGCSISPGVSISLNALSKRTAQLPEINLDYAGKVMGRNTPDCMKAGIIYGNAAMLDGMISRFLAELGRPATVVATGGHARYIVPHCRQEIIYNPKLLLEGLYFIYQKNI